jgi:hypothetical protein
MIQHPAQAHPDMIGRICSLLLLGGLVLGLAGCALHMGSKTIARDRFDYANAITTSWKDQMLLNTVKARYIDPPVFLDVQQIVAQYTFEATGTINAPHWDGVSGESAATATGRWSESPTITFNPMTGDAYIKTLVRPIEPADLLGLVEAGWPIDAVFSVGVRSINGLHATSHTMLKKDAGNADFYRVLTLLRQLQDSGAVAMRIEETSKAKDKDKEDDDSSDEKSKAPGHTIMILHSRALDEAGQRASQEVRRLLRLRPDADELSLVFGTNSKNDHEIAMLTRSMIEILAETSQGVDVPAGDLEEGRAVKMDDTAASGATIYVLRVHSSDTKPRSQDAFSIVHYRNHWFWVDDRDLHSKRGLGFLMALFTMLQSGTSAAPPVLTISRP